MFLRLKQWFLFLILAAAAWLPQADAMVRPLHSSGGDLAACLTGSQAVSSPILPTVEEETYVLVYVYDTENPYNGVFCFVQSPLGLAGYFFGGTGNSLDAGKRSSVEILYEAWKQDINGEAYYVPGVMSGRNPDNTRASRKWYFLWLMRGMLSEGAAGRTLGQRAEQMIKYLEAELPHDKEVNVFGFSRGSTTALEFLNIIHDNMNSENPETRKLYSGIKINFVALWDTVDTTASSYRTDLPKGMTFMHKPLHFIAVDERRGNFFDEEVLNISGALQIGYRGVHADVGGYVYSDKQNVFGGFSRADAVHAAGLIGLKFNEEILNSYRSPIDWTAVPTDNSSVVYNDNERRVLPADMYVGWSVTQFGKHTNPYNAIGQRKVIGYNEWFKWAERNAP